MQKLFVGGWGFEGVTTPAPPKNFNQTLYQSVVTGTDPESIVLEPDPLLSY